MFRILSMCLEALLAAVFLVPALLVFNKYRFHDWNRTGLYIIFSIYLAAMYAVVGLPSITYAAFDLNINFIPFLYMFSDLGNTLLNLLLFMPLGFFLPLLWEPFQRLRGTAWFGFCVSLLIEVLQIFTYRATDVNDLMTNTLGTVLGYTAARVILKLAPAHLSQKNTKDLPLLCGLTFGVMFFLQPFLSSAVWELLYR